MAGTAFAGTVPVVGNIRGPNGSRFTGTVRMTLNYPATDTCSGNITAPNSATFGVANGTIASGAVITPNDCLSPANTFYVTQFYTSQGQLVRQNNFYVSTPVSPATQFNLGTAVPTTLTSSNISFATLANINTVVDNIRLCAGFSGATAGAKIIACIADLPSTGGTADARGLEGTQTITGTIAITKPVTLILGAASYTASNSVPFTTSGGGITVMGIGATATMLTIPTGIDGFNPGAGTRISNFAIVGPNSASSGNSCIDGGSADQVEIDHMDISKCGDMGINQGGSAGYWNIHDNHVHHNINNGVFLPGGVTGHNRVTNNLIDYNGSQGVDLNSSYNLIANNQVLHNGYSNSGTDCWGILAAAVTGINADYNTIANNEVDQSNCQNIIVRPTTGQSASYNVIVGNVATRAAAANGDGIVIDGSAAGTATGNIISSNTVSSNARDGVLVDGSVGTASFNVVIGNNIQNNGANGIEASGVDNSFQDNLVLNNSPNLSIAGTRPLQSGNKSNTADGGFYIQPKLGIGMATGAYGSLDVRSGTTGVDGVFFGDSTNGWVLTEDGSADACLRITASGVVTTSDRFCVSSGGNISMPFPTAGTGITLGTGGTKILKHLSVSAGLVFNSGSSLAANTCYSGAITVSGIAEGDSAYMGIPSGWALGASFSAITTANTVTIEICNITTGSLTNPGSKNYRVDVFMH